MSVEATTTHFRACNLCEAICGLEIVTQGEEIISIRGDHDDALSRGHICPKAVALQDIHNDPDRLKQPLERTAGGDWREIGWDDAFDTVARRMRALQRRHGRDALAVYFGNPHVHSYGSILYARPLLRTLRTKSRFSATSADQLPHQLVAHWMYGHQLLLPIPDLDRTHFFLVLGANPVASNGSMMTAPGFERRLKELRQRGGQLVVVDPRRTETARMADRHHFVRPGTDALLLMALLNVILGEGLDDPGELADLCNSRDSLQRLVAGFPPQRVAAATGIDAEDIRSLGRDFAAAPSAVCYGRFGVSTHEFGATSQWLINIINIVTGNLDRPGGAMFSRPAVDLLASTSRGHLGRWKSRVRGLPEFGGELPVAVLAEEMLTEGPGQIRGLLTVAGNPVLSTPNGAQLDAALEQLELMVSIDFYLNETTRHAHLILPPTAALEHDHYDLIFNLLAVRNVARYSPATLAPGPDTRHDWRIFSELERRMGPRSLGARFKRTFSRRLGPRRLLGLGLRSGPYGAGLNPFGRGLTLGRLERSPHGIDFGPLEPCLPGRLATSDKRIELVPKLLLEDSVRLLRRLEDAQPSVNGDGTLRLIGRRDLRSNNSWMHNYARLMRGKERCTLLIHPTDATRLGVETEQRVAVVSRTGRIVVPVEVTDEMMPGVVSLPHGWGHDRSGTHLAEAQRHPGASLNDITDELEVDSLCGTSILNGVPIRIEPAGC